MRIDALKSTRLVGGTSLALQYGHRQSIDLDFFGTIDCDEFELQDELNKIGELQIRQSTKNIKSYTIDGVKVDIVNYSYPWIDSAIIEEGIRLASPKDIAAMKVSAIDGRGSKKDFIDMYFLLEKYSMRDIFEFYIKKYGNKSLLRALMAMTYFGDAESQAMPLMFNEVPWDKIKSRIYQAVLDYRKI